MLHMMEVVLEVAVLGLVAMVVEVVEMEVLVSMSVHGTKCSTVAQLGLSSKHLSTMHPAIWGIWGKPQAPFFHKNV